MRRADLLKRFMDNKADDEALINLLCLPTVDQVNNASSMMSCNCPSCILAQHKDFALLKSALEELYERYNSEHGTDFSCNLLPKFHPELNAIERCWGRMKWHVRRYCDGTIETCKDQ
eukprot:gene26443-31957_t